MSPKIIKDSIHGYISLNGTFSHIIDSPEFQRLKHIEQGSFRVLYPAARHDRFIHSLGTYHLATMFAENFIKNIQEDVGENNIEERKLEKIKNTFYYAALLHDIGHAPFSHTTEKFFAIRTEKDGLKSIEKQMFQAIEEVASDNEAETFKKEYLGCSPSPHEIMSAIILSRNAKNFLQEKVNDYDLELAVRMVIGCTYDYNEFEGTEEEKLILGIKNCFIRLLNSQTVDVDKLDYITRDTQMSGFANAQIDIGRLVRSVTAVKLDNKEWLYPAFRKNALSVIDNVFRAKTEQGLWMVSHPIVLYDSELLSYCINKLHIKIDDDYIKNVFSIAALGKEGVKLQDKNYRLLNDIDISADLRRFYDEDSQFQELYERYSRRHPIWKSYYEYKFLFNSGTNRNIEKHVFEYFKGLMDYMKASEIFVLNETSYDEIKSSEDASLEVKEAATFLYEFCHRNDISLDFVLLPSTNSFSAKFDPESIYISFGKLPLREGLNYTTYRFLKETEENDDKRRLFYLYSKDRFSRELLLDFKTNLFQILAPQKKPRV